MQFHEQKIDKILSLLNKKTYWNTAELAAELETSRSTIQRCLKELDDMGLVQRIHGGVKKPQSEVIISPVSLDDRLKKNLPAKQAICRKALTLLGTQEVMYLDAGTTIFPLVQLLDSSPQNHIEVITNDVTSALELSRRQIKHVLLGGQMHPVTQSLSGPHTQMLLGHFIFDICLISTDSIDPDSNVSCSVSSEAILKRLAVERSKKSVLMATREKWRKNAGSFIGTLKDFDYWIIDEALPEIKDACRSAGVELIEAE